MRYNILAKLAVMGVALSVFFLSWGIGLAEEPKGAIPDKALCAKMLRFGEEAYSRGKYLDAKGYFRKAIQADPTSQKAWGYYDLAAIFALAEKAEQNAELIAPGVSMRQEGAASGKAQTESAPPPAPKPQKDFGFKIGSDEGC
jgi:tetratricopeptide (TPR) repeat protein